MNNIDLIIIKDEDDIEAAEVMVEGFIDNKEYRFLLDTGCARTFVVLDDYTGKFKCNEKNSTSGVFTKTSNDLITIPSIELGAIVKTNFTIARASKDNNAARRNLIGMDILKDYSLFFSFESKKVIENPENKTNYVFHDIEFGSKYHPYINVHFAEGAAKAVWDTGAGMTVVDMNFIKKHPYCFQEVGQSVGTDSTGTQQSTPMYIMNSVTIGNNVFPPHKVAGVDLSNINSSTEIPMDMILGFSTLSKADWLFDFPNGKWTITKMINNN